MRQSVDLRTAARLDAELAERAAHANVVAALTTYTYARSGWYEPGRRVIDDSRERITELDRRWAAVVWC